MIQESMKKYISKQNRALLYELVRTDFKLRYQGSMLGYAWSLLRPLFMFAILYAVFTQVFRIGGSVPNFPVYLLLGIVLWNFFQETTQQGLGAIVGRGDLIRKIKIPRWMIIVSTSASAFINLTLNFFVVVVLALILGVEIQATMLLFPIFIAQILLFSLGLSLILSALFVKFRDISYIWEVVLQAGFYATPILYPVAVNANFITNELALKALFMNPVAAAVQGARDSFVTDETLTISEVWGSSAAHLITIATITVFLLIGVMYFRRESKHFAENL